MLDICQRASHRAEQWYPADGLRPRLIPNVSRQGKQMRAMSHSLFDPFMAPECVPDSPYTPTDRTTVWRAATDGLVFVEVYRRANRTFGFRYVAWVAWRDAGGEAVGHGWWRTEREGLVTDEYETACKVAEAHARSKGVDLEPAWRFVV